MPKKQVHLWMETDTLSLVKKGAVRTGMSLSGYVEMTLRREIGAEGAREGSSEADREPGMKDLLASGFGETAEKILALERAVLDAQGREPGSGQASGYPWTKAQVRFLISTVARIDRLFLEYNAVWGRNDQQQVMTRARTAAETGENTAQRLGLEKEKEENAR